MKHVFVETNWVVAVAAPAHHKLPAAQALLERGASGEVRLYVPSICLTEARQTILRKCQPRNEANAIRDFLAWSRADGRIDAAADETVRRVLDMFEGQVKRELRALDSTFDGLRRLPGVEVFALDDGMLARAITLGSTDLELEPYDQAVLAAVLARGEQLRDAGETDVSFCELDGHLQPWDRDGNVRKTLTDLYDAARVWVFGDFELSVPARPFRR